jgi:hypothetical protein
LCPTPQAVSERGADRLSDPERRSAPRSRVGLTGCGSGREVISPHWPTLLRQLPTTHPVGALKRLKQWLRIAAAYGTFAHFDAVKRAASVDELLRVVDAS